MNKTLATIVIVCAFVVGLVFGHGFGGSGQSLAGTVENFPVLFQNGLQTSAVVVADATKALFQIGLPTRLSGGNTSGTFIGMNTPGSTSADLVNLQVNGTSEFKVTSSGAMTAPLFASASIGSSSSTPSALGSAISGHFTATSTSQSASTTAVTANSTIIVQPENTTPIAGTTCNTGAPATTTISSVIAGNGFIIKYPTAPSGATTPYCYSYLIVN